MITDTELKLSFWRDGATNSERLAATILRLHGYEQIDPQSPLGGPDGKKDILCAKGGLTWVGAVHFPNGPITFSATKKKFSSDLAGMPSGPRGFVFVTNQNLSPTQRKTLVAIAAAAEKECDILHLQLLQTLLDAPSGYGPRIQFLGIPMSMEEQLSWVVESDSQTANALATHTRELLALRASVERMNAGQNNIMRTMALATPVATPDLIAASSFVKSDSHEAITASLAPEMLLMIHRFTCFDLPSRVIGQLRTQEVWLGNYQGRRATHLQPPAPREVQLRLSALCKEWRAEMKGLRTEQTKILAIAKFHAALLLIHPFLDGNGRVARAVLMQQSLDLFGKADMSLLNKGADYYTALEAADKGDFGPLAGLIQPVIEK